MFINGFIIFALVVAIAFLYGLFIFLSDHKENKCEMTYMFEYPQYVRIHQEADDYYRKYGLYAYGEGYITQRARNKNFDGVPVLFIPGNAGSYKQVRSLASVALRKALNSRPGFHFDYFTLDLNEELSALNGALLGQQMQYANHSIYSILKLYAENRVIPASVIIVGHSMGGVIAEGLLTQLPESSALIPLVITLATPHKRLPVTLDAYAHEFYNHIQQAYNKERKTTLVTLSGGYRDFLVTTSLAKGGDLSVVNSGTKSYLAERYTRPTTIDNQGEWIEYLPRQYSVQLMQGTNHVQWYMVRYVEHSMHETLTILAVNLEVTDWVYACQANVIRGHSKVCKEGIHLSHLSEIAPTVKHKRRILHLNMHELHKDHPNYTHFVAKILPTSEPVILHFDIYGPGERKVTVNLPNRFSLKRQVIIEETIANAVHYELELPQLQHITQAYQLYVEPIKCEAKEHHVAASLIVPWGHQNIPSYFNESDPEPMDLRLHTPKPADYANSTAFVDLTLDPACRYRVSIESSVPLVFGQVARFYSPLLVANIAAVVLLVFRHQINNMATKGTCSFFFTALKSGAKPYYVLPAVKIISQLLSVKLLIAKILPVPDWQILNEESMDFFLLPLILYFVSVGIVWFLAMALSISIVFFQSTVRKVVLKLLSRAVTGPVTWSDWLMKAMHKLPGFVACMLILLSVSACGGLALWLGLVFYFLKLTQMSQDILEEIVTKLLEAVCRKLRTRTSGSNAAGNSVITQGNQPKNSEATQSRETDKAKATGDYDSGASSSTGSDNKRGNPENSKANYQIKSSESSIEESSVDAIETEELNDEANMGNDKNHSTILSLLNEILVNNEIFFHFTVFCVWFLIACLNTPSVLTWAHNFRYYPKLEPDPSFIPGLVLCTCAFPLWQLKFPRSDRKWYMELSYAIYICAVVSLVYGTISLFRLNYILTAVILIVTVHQLVAPKKPGEETTEETSTPSPKTYYDKAKAKLE